MVLAALLALGISDLKAYRTWTCVTPQAVDMAPAIAISCIGPASWDSSEKNPHIRKRFKVWVNPIGRPLIGRPLFREVKPGVWKEDPIRFPEGTTIVKEKYDATTSWETLGKGAPRPLPARPELLTIMVKGKQGSKTKTGDWSYYVADPDLKRLDSSQEARCASCHAARPQFDFTFRNYGSLTH
jgi:hypothetical protein